MKSSHTSLSHHHPHVIMSIAFCFMICMVISNVQPAYGAPPADYFYDVDTTAEGTINSGCDDDVDDNDCSLRGAITLVNTTGNVTKIYQINLPAGNYQLTLPGNDNLNVIGDLDVYGPSIYLRGDGMTETLITAFGSNDRIIDHFGTHSLNIYDLTIQNGSLGHGGGGGAGIRSRDAGSLLLDGVYVNNNHSTGVAIGDYGGGIYIDDTDLTITGESLVYGNSACHGGGVYITNSVSGIYSNIYNSIISTNTADCGNGGGIYVNGTAEIDIDLSDLRYNEAEQGAGYYDSPDTTLTMSDSRVFNNTIVNLGIGPAGMEIVGQATLDDTQIFGNDADSGPGGIRVYIGGRLTMTDSVIYANNGGFVGGVSAVYNTSALLQRVQITGNVGNNAGGVYIGVDGNMSLENVTIAENEGFMGGGLYLVDNISADLNHVTIADNVVDGNAGAVFFGDDGLWSPRNSIFQYVGAETVCYFNSTYFRTSGGHNIISDDSCDLTDPTDLYNTDPGLRGLDNYDSTLQTMAPLPGSPAIDGAVVSDLVTTDQRGKTRIDGDGDGIIKSDIGAHEFYWSFFLPLLQVP